MAKITIKKIAQDLNMSRNTVSMALNNDPRVSEKTRLRVANYVYSHNLAEYKVSKVSQPKPLDILVLKRLDQTAYWSRVITGITDEAKRFNFIVTVSSVTQEDIDHLCLPVGYSGRMDACLFLHKFSPEYCSMILKGIPIGIFLDYTDILHQDPIFGDIICCESTRSMMKITSSLIAQGMRRIAYVCPYYINAESFYNRYMGYRAAMEYADIPIDPDLVMTSYKPMDKTILFQDAFRQFKTLPDAFVCCNDETALQFAKLLVEKGIRVPEDCAITGFDNDEYVSFQPFLTTVESHAELMGRRLVQQLVWRLDHPDDPFEQISIVSDPIYRHSSERFLTI